jgi:hypothetical protein
MRTKRDCTRCEYLPKCLEVTAQRLVDGYTCNDWHKTSDHDLAAREQVIQEFGPAALRFALPPEQHSAKTRRRK